MEASGARSNENSLVHFSRKKIGALFSLCLMAQLSIRLWTNCTDSDATDEQVPNHFLVC